MFQVKVQLRGPDEVYFFLTLSKKGTTSICVVPIQVGVSSNRRISLQRLAGISLMPNPAPRVLNYWESKNYP